jgi:hypothetical protein
MRGSASQSAKEEEVFSVTRTCVRLQGHQSSSAGAPAGCACQVLGAAAAAAAAVPQLPLVAAGATSRSPDPGSFGVYIKGEADARRF